MLMRRVSCDIRQKTEYDAAIVQHIRSLSVYDESRIIALYLPVRGEVDLRALMSVPGKTFVVPRVEKDSLLFCRIIDLDECRPGSFGIPEPCDADPVCTEHIDLMLVPGVGFDRRGYRLGYGKGFYDRLLAAYPRVFALGVCHEEFLVDALPVDSWDTPVTAIVTQTGIVKPEGEV